MKNEDIMIALADILEVEPNAISADDKLEDFEAWDSVAVLSVISLYTDITGKFIHASEILKMTTVSDIINLLSI